MSDYVANKIRYYRKAKGWTQEELASKCDGISYASIRRYETIEEGNRDPKTEDLRIIAKALGVDPSEFIEPFWSISVIDVMDEDGNHTTMDPSQEVWPKNGDPIFTVEFEQEKEAGRMTDDDLRVWRDANPKSRVDATWLKFNEAGREKAAEQVELVAKIPEYLK